MTPKTATLIIDDVAKTLDADGKLTMNVDFDTELNLVTELTGFVKDEQKVTIKAEDNKVDINLAKAKVRQFSHSLLAFIKFFVFLSFCSSNLK